MSQLNLILLRWRDPRAAVESNPEPRAKPAGWKVIEQGVRGQSQEQEPSAPLEESHCLTPKSPPLFRVSGETFVSGFDFWKQPEVIWS